MDLQEIFAPYMKSGAIYKIFNSQTRAEIIAKLKEAKKSGADMSNDVGWILNLLQDPEIIKALVELGADPNHVGILSLDNSPNSPLEYFTPLLNEIKVINAEKVKLLLELGADPNFVPPVEGGGAFPAPLFYLNLYYNSTTEQKKRGSEIIALLAEYGADLNVKRRGDTFMNTNPVSPRQYIPIKTLTELGASVEPAPDGDTPLHVYVKRYPCECAQEDVGAMLDAGIDLEAKNRDNETAFATACSFYAKERYRMSNYISSYFCGKVEYKNLLKILTKRGANIYAPTKDGTPAIETLPKRLQKELT